MSTPLSSPGVAAFPRRLLPARVPPDPARLLSQAESEALFHRIVQMTTGGGDTMVTIRSTWTANLRWARNRPTTSGDTTERSITITRRAHGKDYTTEIDQMDDATLRAAVHTLEQQAAGGGEVPDTPEMLAAQQYLSPPIWSEATYQMPGQGLSDAARRSVDPVVDAHLDAAGYAEVGAATWAIYNTRGLTAYAATTGAMYTETVRQPDGSGSGWAGRTHLDWAKLDAPQLSTRALQKCRDSRNPVAIEPGRYTTILEPQAVSLLLYPAIAAMNREDAEAGKGIYAQTPPKREGERGTSKLGLPLFDARLTITSDPMDPEAGFIPFDPEGNPYHPVTWVEQGRLKNLAYSWKYAHQVLKTDAALPNPLAFRVSGGETSLDEMIATTERGILLSRVNRFMINKEEAGIPLRGMTRDGLWLIERGKITHPVKNMYFTEWPLVLFNKVLQIGPAERTIGVQEFGFLSVLRDLPSRVLNDGHMPAVVPPMKIKDFNFTRLTDAI